MSNIVDKIHDMIEEYGSEEAWLKSMETASTTLSDHASTGFDSAQLPSLSDLRSAAEEKKLKAAGDYFDDACSAFENRKNKMYDIYDEPYFVEAIRKAQMDAIELTYNRIMAAIWKNIDTASELAKMRNVVDELLNEVAK